MICLLQRYILFDPGCSGDARKFETLSKVFVLNSFSAFYFIGAFSTTFTIYVALDLESHIE